MVNVTEISQLFEDIRKAASEKVEPIICNRALMDAGQRTEVSMTIALPCNASSRARRLERVNGRRTVLDWPF
jgi:hypothetical protein